MTITGRIYGTEKRKPYQLGFIAPANELRDIGTLTLKALGYGYPVLFIPTPESGTLVVVYCLNDGDFDAIQAQLRIEAPAVLEAAR